MSTTEGDGVVDLDILRDEITSLGERIKTLKSSNNTSNNDDTVVGALVNELLNAKRTYAQNNNGIGVDGKPYQEPMSNAEKKKKAKAEKAKAAAAAAAAATASAGGGDGNNSNPAKMDSDPNSVNAQKKAAKKAAKKAQKNAMKAGGGDGGGGGGGGDAATTTTANGGGGGGSDKKTNNDGGVGQLAASSSTSSEAAPSSSPAVVVAKKPSATAATTTTTTTKSASTSSTTMPMMGATSFINKLQPLQVVINPNVALTKRPIVALSVACLTDTAIDVQLISDHTIGNHTALAMEEGGVVIGDFAMARYLARRVVSQGKSILQQQHQQQHEAVIDGWVDYAQSLVLLPREQQVKAVVMTLEHAFTAAAASSSSSSAKIKPNTGVAGRRAMTYLVGDDISLADLCMFAAIGFPTQSSDLQDTLSMVPKLAMNTLRWIRMMSCHPALQEATQLCVGIVNNTEALFDGVPVLEPLVSGMNALEGGIGGRVTTRFPPEPSGYLHIGHAKAVLLNDYYATRYNGRLIVRFDDTNPSKEKQEYQESIIEDLGKLGVQPTLITFTSDYFDAITGYAKILINKGLAYMDDTPQEQMKAERAERQESKHRIQTVDEAQRLFDLMCSGSDDGSVWCLRAKINMNSDNGTMRDPVLFRQNLIPHHRSGTTYKAYPTYDLACPIVDSIEGVTHALRTTEYNDRDEQYQWILKALGLRRVRIHAFSRLNFKNTVLSKRKLAWFVDNQTVTGWNDARFPTIQGIIRRGINITALRNFIYSQGASRRVVLMDWFFFWSENKKVIDKTAKRYMAIDKSDHVCLVVTNAPDETDYAYVETNLHPKDPSIGKRTVRICKKVLLETVDVEGMNVDEEIVLVRWGVVKITKKIDEGNGKSSFEGIHIPDGDIKSAKRKISWLADVSNNTPVILTEFDNLISKDKLEEDDNFQDYINPNTIATTNVIGDAGLKTLVEHDVIQLERRGFYRVDSPYINSTTKPLILYMIPDGKSKAMSGQTGKLAHR